MKRISRLFAILWLSLTFAACQPTPNLPGGLLTPLPSATNTPFQPAPATPTDTPGPTVLWIGPGVPQALREVARGRGLPLTEDAAQATLVLDVAPSPVTAGSADARPAHPDSSTWIYALVAPFPTVTDEVTAADLRAAWGDSSSAPFAGRPLWMAESTLAAFTALWGEPDRGAVQTAAPDELLEKAWGERPAWAIVPFEALEPRWKVLSVDGQSPIHKDFDPSAYPLQVAFALQPAIPEPSTFDLPPTNRDAEKMTTVVLTGVTALVRATAYTMEVKGVAYPGRDVRDWLANADFAHISNEVPFFGGCPYPNPNQTKLVFCSSPRYIELLEYVGADVVELSGDHFGDYGYQAMLETLEIYREHNILYYGGGENLQDGLKPLTLEHNGNKIAFIGCNAKPAYAKASDTQPGAALCNFTYMTEQISALRDQGYVVIVTFQHQECYSVGPCYTHEQDFRRVADAGAAIVSGSQAHYPHVMEFYNGAFIHYGLGNFFFDQMGNLTDLPEGVRREFVDRHVIYAGRHISTELLTAMLEDYSRPRPMTPQERALFLMDYFTASGWGPFPPTPTPAPTVTLTPIILPLPPTTLTPPP